MKYLRIPAAIALALMSLLNVGAPFSTDPTPAPVLTVAIVALAVAGFVAAFGLIRNASWGIPAAVIVAGVNVVAAIIALVTDTEGALIGIVLSSVALVFAVLAGSGRDHAALGGAA